MNVRSGFRQAGRTVVSGAALAAGWLFKFGRMAKKKWFQVTRFTASLPAVMNGTESCSQDSRAVYLFAPRSRLSTASSQRSQLRLLVKILSEAGFSQRLFARSQRLPLRAATVPRSTFPACCFDALLACRQARTTFRSPVCPGLDPRHAASSLRPVS